MTGNKKPIEERIRDNAQDYRDPEIEYQLLAYLVRTDASGCTMIRKEWLSDILLQDILIILIDLKMTLTKAMLLNELSARKMIGPNEEGLYEEVVDQLYDIDISKYTSKNTRHMMLQLLRLAETRSIIIGCGEIVGKMKSFDLDDAKRKLSVLSRPSGIIDNENAGYYLSNYENRVGILRQKQDEVAESDNAQAGVPTGIYRFDKLVGGVMPQEFGVLGGITGVGKTAALICFGVYSWLNGYDTFIVSGEMSRTELEFRIDSHLTRIHGMKFRTAELEDDDFKRWDTTIKMYRAKQDNFLYVSAYPRKFTVDDIERDITRVEEETGRKLRVLCMDYINIMDPKQRVQGTWKDQAEAVWDFKGLVAEHNLVGWTAGQVIDDAYDKELYTPKDLKYARAISECAPIIVALIRTEKDIIENRMKLQVLKMRNADPPKKPIVLTPKLNIMRIHEEVNNLKTLKGRLPDTLDVTKKTRKARPSKSLHGKGVK